MPYAVILKHAGILTRSLYLIATAIGLGSVAQGYGDTGLRRRRRTATTRRVPVGSFVVGTPAAESSVTTASHKVGQFAGLPPRRAGQTRTASW